MSEYRRLISYIYEYEGKEKGKNVGFVKLEARNGQCRLNVNVKRMYVGGNAIGVYLLSKDGGHVFLGNMFVRNGGGEFRATVDAKNVEGSGVGLDGYYGLTVHDVKNTWRSYTTVWEDAAVPVSADEEQQGADLTAKCDSDTGPTAQEILPGSDECANEQMIPSVVKEIEEEIARSAELGTGDVMAEFTEPKEDALQHKTTGDWLTDDSIHTEYIDQDLNMDEKKEEEKTIETLGREEEITAQSQTDVPMVSPELESPELLRYLQETEDTAADPEQLWQELRKSYPKIQPFDYDGHSEVLTIRPQDIGKLPRENWIYGNNSFLLHGYYNFRYLILVRLDDSDGKSRYLIGVPGHYYSSEKYMATMFGFPNFVLSKKQPPNDGRFGYWYTDIKMR